MRTIELFGYKGKIPEREDFIYDSEFNSWYFILWDRKDYWHVFEQCRYIAIIADVARCFWWEKFLTTKDSGEKAQAPIEADVWAEIARAARKENVPV